MQDRLSLKAVAQVRGTKRYTSIGMREKIECATVAQMCHRKGLK